MLEPADTPINPLVPGVVVVGEVVHVGEPDLRGQPIL